MIDFNQAVSIIRRNGGFKPNRKDTSYYRTYTVEDNRPLQARVSNHGTWLWTWYDKDFDPSYAINFCVVFSENGEYDSDVSVDMEMKDEEGNVVGQRKTFEVIQYVYNCQLLDINDATLINQQIQSIWKNKGFKDPFANTPKHAKVMRLKPNEPIEPIVENKELNTYLDMNKKLIRLTEEDLHRIVKESVNKILNEMGTIVHPGGVTEPPKTYRVYKQYIGINYLGEEPNLLKDNATGEYIRDLVSRAQRKGIFYKDGTDSNDNYYFDIKKADMDADERIRYTIVRI